MIDEKDYLDEVAIVEKHWPAFIKRLRDAEANNAELKKRLEKCEAEWQQPDDALLRIGAPAAPFLEQVEWMRKRLKALEEAARPFLEFYDDMDTYAMREAQKRLAELLDKGN